ncbi:MAG: Uncharacterized protein XD57_1522 [Thermotoga petrophila]|uniref:Uncharacterized protein n=1 Tax=Thermotoga petrophila TaxID=93929 RepID=A0A101EPL3_9THEM|nr:MAG: Uncharacterized protein XD57_1522 [Thermotoga petrophila]
MVRAVVGRFPIYVEEEFISDEKKWEFVLSKIESIDPAVASFVEEAPDGTMRVIGPFRARSGYALVISSPLSSLFHFLVLNIPRVLNAVVKPGKAYVEIYEKRDLFDSPGVFTLKVKGTKGFSLKQLKEDTKLFLGVDVEPAFQPISLRNTKNGVIVTVKTLTPETTALVKLSRLCGTGESRRYGHGDVEIYRIVE